MLVPATLLWSNLHGSAYLSPIFCIFLLTEKLFQWLTTKMAGQNIKQFPLRELVLVLLVTATLLITPYGFAPVQLVFKRFIIQDIVIRSYSVQEHLPLAWGAHPMYTMLFITTAASFFLNWKNCRFFHILVFFGVSWLACSSVRYVGLAALIHAMLLGHNISQARDLFTRYRFIATTWLFHTTMPVILIAAAWFIFTSTFGPEKVYKFGLGINQKRFPGKAVQLLKDNNVSGNIFNSWQYGGYIQWFLPESKTFIDGRCLDEHLEIHEKLKSLSLQEQYSYLQKHDVIAAILARTDIQFSRLFEISPDYSLTYMDSQSMLYLRNDIKQKISATKNKKPFRFIQLQGFDISYLYPLAQGANKEEVESELRRAVSIFQENFHSFLQLAFFLDLQKKAESIDYYLKAAQLNPSLAFSHYNLGIQGGNAAIKYKQWEKGQKILSLAIKHNNKDPQMFFMLGIVHYEQGNYLEAARFYNKSLSIAPNNVTTLINLGYTYLDAGEYQNSLINFKKAYALSPDSEGALYGIALALEKSGKPDSTTTWKEFLSKFPDSKWAGQAKRYLDKH